MFVSTKKIKINILFNMYECVNLDKKKSNIKSRQIRIIGSENIFDIFPGFKRKPKFKL